MSTNFDNYKLPLYPLYFGKYNCFFVTKTTFQL